MKKYIVVEGIHGSGKSTVAKKLAHELQGMGIKAQYYHFPNENEKLGQVIREVLTKPDLYTKREVLGQLYAAASNMFHIQTQDDDITYVLDRDPVTTGLIFQRDIPWDIRLVIYRYGIQALKDQGTVIYLDVNQQTAQQRRMQRNEALNSQDEQVWKDKSKDQFVVEKFQEMTQLYETHFFEELEKIGLSYQRIDNMGKLDDTVKNIIDMLVG